LEHPVTSLRVNLAEAAHIVAFREYGPRGDDPNRPEDIHSLENLMLLCRLCHKQIDDSPGDFSRDLLEQYKDDHERRIQHVTGLGPDMQTTVVQLKGLVGGQAVDIPASEMYGAVAPRWPTDRHGHVIDLTSFSIEDSAGTEAAARQITKSIRRLYEPGMDADRSRHVSVFALAPIHILVHLGSQLSDKISTDLFQRHRGNERGPWTWRSNGEPVDYGFEQRQNGTERSQVALVLSLSGPVDLGALPATIDQRFNIYEARLRDRPPGIDFLNTRADLLRFRRSYREFLAGITGSHGPLEALHIFPAVPSPIAVALGHDILPKVHPDLLVYDFDRHDGGFNFKLRIRRNEQ
jgi:hypothetical protein